MPAPGSFLKSLGLFAELPLSHATHFDLLRTFVRRFPTPRTFVTPANAKGALKACEANR